MEHLRPAALLALFFIVVTGVAFPVVVWAIGSVAFPNQAHGSLIRDAQGNVVGSALIGQTFTRPEYFHPRPSAAGIGYDAASSGGTNLGPTSDKLVDGIKDDPKTTGVDESYLGFKDLAKAYRRENGLADDSLIPADAATRSASGLDPHISPANATLQAGRVARARSMSAERVNELVRENTELRTLGLFGEPRVNVLLLNRALDGLR
jgi:potassium-transporting ATPase KdpC subunit